MATIDKRSEARGQRLEVSSAGRRVTAPKVRKIVARGKREARHPWIQSKECFAP